MASGNGTHVIVVVAAEIRDKEGRYLLTQRNPHAVLPLLWEFPGGRVHDDEKPEDALSRCLRDKLGIEIEVQDRRLQVERDYETYRVQLQAWSATIRRGKPTREDVWDYRWVRPTEFAEYTFPPADKETVDQLVGMTEPTNAA